MERGGGGSRTGVTFALVTRGHARCHGNEAIPGTSRSAGLRYNLWSENDMETLLLNHIEKQLPNSDLKGLGCEIDEWLKWIWSIHHDRIQQT